MELNPDHPTTAALQWHKVAAIFLYKLGGEVLITEKDILEALALAPLNGTSIAAIGEGDAIRFKIVTEERDLMRRDRQQ